MLCSAVNRLSGILHFNQLTINRLNLLPGKQHYLEQYRQTAAAPFPRSSRADLLQFGGGVLLRVITGHLLKLAAARQKIDKSG